MAEFKPITLAEMEQVRLMNRIDTKYVTNMEILCRLLPLLQQNYKMQEIEGIRNSDYHTIYFDTADAAMYHRHHNGCATRQKIRMREYADTGTYYLEVKRKNNKGRTRKGRIQIDSFENYDENVVSEFIQNESWFRWSEITPHLENRFYRLTLVNNDETERLTIDTELRFHNYISEKDRAVENGVIIELKQDGSAPSFIKPILRDMRLFPTSFSKYCIGSMLTNEKLKANMFRKKLIKINKQIERYG